MNKIIIENRNQYSAGLFQIQKRRSKIIRHTPSANVEDRQDEYVIMLAAPGFQCKDIEINIQRNRLCIKAKKETHASGYKIQKNVQTEYDFSNWTRNFLLPKNADASFAYAYYLNGELQLHFPKSNNPLTSPSTKVTVYSICK